MMPATRSATNRTAGQEQGTEASTDTATEPPRPTASPEGTEEVWDPDRSERRNITLLLRWIAVFVAWPSLSLGLIFLLEWEEHFLHIVGLIPLGIAGLVLFWKAPRIAARFYPPPGPERD